MSENSTNFEQIFCNIIRSLEFLIHLILLPISFIFIFFIFRTSLLHLNLKFILLWQCFCNLIYSFSRNIQTFISFYNAYKQTYSESILNVTLGTLLTIYGTLILGIIEIALIGYIGTFLYLKHSLTERYQLTENIRTSRQLKPTFILHFINIFVSSLITILLNYIKINNSFIDLLFVFVCIITAFCNLLIEITIIIFHPILCSQFKQLLKKFNKKFLKIFSTKVGIFEASSPSIKSLPKTIDGNILIIKENNELTFNLRKNFFMRVQKIYYNFQYIK
ncbi:hypothetical protein Mgra_00009748 [Meloidogyne graminicola]|uniref:Uncharacterized protein n=1 Tax=Meloidogyne graminicola TaxID=189291 RepID=A0A8S9Z722_9BILA|nr:hypothetical protein Mgra_00009748 [Meloidogyne graminicola]